MPYTGVSEKLLKKYNCSVGDSIVLHSKSERYQGIVMPRTETGDDRHIVLKLDNGYNVGIEVSGSEKIEKLMGALQPKGVRVKMKKDPKKPSILILHTGGTLASKVDYRTGGVVARFEPEDILELYPNLAKLANIDASLVCNILSEDIEPAHHQLIVKEIEKAIKNKVDGIIVTHGTDTLHYTSAALSFMIQDSPIPIILVGSQRSSDRGSTDALMNLTCAVHFIVNSDFSGVGVCMHATVSDDFCLVHPGTKVRKMHTSRRDAFRTLNSRPWAKVWPDGKVVFIRKDYPKKDSRRKPTISEKLEKKVALIESYVGFEPELVRFLSKQGYKGLILEGTGLGHFPVSALDEHTKKHVETLENIKGFIDAGGLVVMTSQCLNGRVNMNVYSAGRDLLTAGVIPGEDMLPEVALAKLKWALANFKGDEAKKIMGKNIAGEISSRSKLDVDVE